MENYGSQGGGRVAYKMATRLFCWCLGKSSAKKSTYHNNQTRREEKWKDTSVKEGLVWPNDLMRFFVC